MSVNVVKVTGYCPAEGCDVVKHQIDFSEEHAVEVVDKAIREHVAAEHPDHEWGASDD